MSRIVLFAVLVALTAVAAATPEGGGLAAQELAFTLSIGDGAGSAVCLARGGDVRGARRLTGNGAYQVAWSPDGRRIALAGGTRDTHPIRVENADGTGLRAVSAPRLATEDDSNPTWSPDGTRIAFSRYVYFGPRTDYRRAGIWIVDLATGREKQISREFAGLVWAPSGDVIAAELGGVFESELLLLTPDGEVVWRRQPAGQRRFDRGLSWSPDGRRLAVGGGLILDREGRVAGRYAPPSTEWTATHSPSWSPDGSSIAFAQSPVGLNARINSQYLMESDLFVVPAGGGAAVALTRTPTISEGAPRFRPEPAQAEAGRSQPCLLRGTPRRDVIRGTAAGDLIDGGGGNDVLHGRAGNDVVVGGPGHDVLDGGPGSDFLKADFGDDRLEARDGVVDDLRGGQGRDRAWIDRRDRVSSVELVSR